MFKAAIFDLDGVITDTAEFHYEAWLELARSMGIEFTREFNEELKGVSRVDSLLKIIDFGGKTGQYSDEEIETLLVKKNEKYLMMLETLSSNDILPGVVSFLNELKANGIRIGLASASKNAPYILEKLGIEEYFETIADPEKVAEGKPSPEIFMLAAGSLNVTPEECIGFEDAYSGVMSLKAAGMKSVAIGEQSVFKELEPTLILKKTSDLKYEQIKEI